MYAYSSKPSVAPGDVVALGKGVTTAIASACTAGIFSSDSGEGTEEYQQ